jgi:hypothetical protein
MTSKVELELQAATGYKPKKGEDDQAYLHRLQEAIQNLKDADWEKLGHDAQAWANEAANIVKADPDDDIPDFEDDEKEKDTEDSEESADDDGEKEQEKKPVKTSKKTEKSDKPERSEKTTKKADKPAAKKTRGDDDDDKKKKTAKSDKKPPGRPLSEGKVEGVKYDIKKLICSDPKISVDDLVKKLGGKMSKVTVSNVRADFRHSLRVLNQLGKLKGVDL